MTRTCRMRLNPDDYIVSLIFTPSNSIIPYRFITEDMMKGFFEVHASSQFAGFPAFQTISVNFFQSLKSRLISIGQNLYFANSLLEFHAIAPYCIMSH
ncbi:hypothetical protein JW926_08760 [Candidatus Sumerlaeota bacterium]|nr:hypothetical protein [Candidatus Sumerlaeota bacterium]